MEHWIEKAVGKMHVYKISQIEIANHIGVTHDYIWMILNGKKKPKYAECRIMTAIDEIIKQRGA